MFGTRYYDPGVGRWTQQDPVAGWISNPSTVNRYVYVGNDPVNRVDPTGRHWWNPLSWSTKTKTRAVEAVGCALSAGASASSVIGSAGTSAPLAVPALWASVGCLASVAGGEWTLMDDD